jgi:hypothetical protein
MMNSHLKKWELVITMLFWWPEEEDYMNRAL